MRQSASIDAVHQGATTAVEEARLFVEAAAACGVEPRTLVARAGLGAADLKIPGSRLPRPAFERLVAHTVLLSGDLDLGLHAAELTAGGHWLPDPLHYAVRSCATVGDQFRTVARYARLLHADAELTFTADARVAHVSLVLPGFGAVARRHVAERLLGALVLLAREHAGPSFAPREVWFSHPPPPDTFTHERLFRAPLRFERAVDALVVGREPLNARVRHGDPALRRVLEAHLASVLPDLEPAAMADLVRRRLRDAVRGPTPAVATIAAALAVSPRTLQRRLADEGTSYQRLASEVREDLARHYLTESRLSISEIAYALGFSDVSAFHRAFKRWTGRTPRAYRDRAAPSPAAPAHARAGAFGQGSGAPGQDRVPSRA